MDDEQDFPPQEKASRNAEFNSQVHRITAGSPTFGEEAKGASETAG